MCVRKRSFSRVGVVLDHLGLNVPDLVAAKAYYDEIMPLLGFETFFFTDTQFSYRPAGDKPGTRIFFYGALEPGDYSRHKPGLQHLAFRLRSRAEVDAAHAKAVGLGSEIIHAPKMWPEYHEHYYSAFWYDPHGFMLEPVCHKPTFSVTQP